jgi:DNA-binding response OmpR family regulator
MKKILVIEDEELVRLNILELLEAENFEGIGAEDGLVGVQLAQDQKPDLIICDVMLPGLDGYEVLTTLRQDPATAIIPLIFLTAKAARRELRQGMELGADDYITKPCTPDELLRAIVIRLAKHTMTTQQHTNESEQVKLLEQKLQEFQTLSKTKDQILNNFCQELRNPLSNINMALHMLKTYPAGPQRDLCLKVLQEEFTREISLLNQVSQLQDFLTPENAKLLQGFNLLRSKTD